MSLLRHDHLHDEGPARLEVRRGVGEHGDLLVLRGDVHDGVGAPMEACSVTEAVLGVEEAFLREIRARR